MRVLGQAQPQSLPQHPDHGRGPVSGISELPLLLVKAGAQLKCRTPGGLLVGSWWAPADSRTLCGNRLGIKPFLWWFILCRPCPRGRAMAKEKMAVGFFQVYFLPSGASFLGN